MLARSALTRQISNATRGRKFSFTPLTEEYPYQDLLSNPVKLPAVQATKLENGLRFVARSRATTGLVNLRFAVLGGSSTESAEQKGAAHFLASSAYVGNSQNSGLRVVRYLESLGTTFNATADREKIVYEAAVLVDNVDPVISVILSSIATPPLHLHVLEENRHFAKQFYDALSQDPSLQLRELVHEAAFGELTGFGSSLYAPKLSALTVDDVLQYRANHFVKENLVVAADGITAEDLKKILDSHTTKFPSGAAQVIPKANFVGGEVKVRNNNEGSAHVALAFGTLAGEAGKVYEVLQTALSQRLHKKKICASTFQNRYHNGGFFGIQTQGSSADIDRILRASIDELKAIAANGAVAESAKVSIGVDNLSALNSRNSASLLLDAFLSGSSAESFADSRSVTAQQVSDAAKAVLKSNPAYAVYGATTGAPSLTAVSKLLA